MALYKTEKKGFQTAIKRFKQEYLIFIANIENTIRNGEIERNSEGLNQSIDRIMHELTK